MCAHPWPKCCFNKWLCWIHRSCAELLLSVPQHVPGALWEEFQSSVKVSILQPIRALLMLNFAVIRSWYILSISTQRHVWRCWFASVKNPHGFLELYRTEALVMNLLLIISQRCAAVGTQPFAGKWEHTAPSALSSGTAGWRMGQHHIKQHPVQSDSTDWTRLALPLFPRLNDPRRASLISTAVI